MMRPEKRRDAERTRHRRNQVLQAAAVCFARHGFHGASMAQISREAGMSAGHIYNYFDSKDAIILAFVERETDDLIDRLREHATRDDPLQAILDDVDQHLDAMLDPHPHQLPFEVYAEASRNPAIAARLKMHGNTSREHLRELVKVGRRRRNLPVPDILVESRINTMIACFQGLSIRALHLDDMDRRGMTHALRVAVRALLMT